MLAAELAGAPAADADVGSGLVREDGVTVLEEAADAEEGWDVLFLLLFRF